jgi:hypothetical protein
MNEVDRVGGKFHVGTSNKLWLVDIDSIAATIRLLEDIFVKGMSHITFHAGTSNKLWLVDTDPLRQPFAYWRILLLKG